MNTVEILAERNRSFAATRSRNGLTMLPQLKTIVIGCVDPRVDPAHVLGLALGDAAVIRNVGGRVTPATLQTMAMLRLLAGADRAPDSAWSLVLLHHTDCGMKHLAAYPDLLAAHFGIAADELDSKHISDPYESVRSDVAALKGNPFLPPELLVSGLVYDVTSGLVERLVEPERLRDDTDATIE